MNIHFKKRIFVWNWHFQLFFKFFYKDSNIFYLKDYVLTASHEELGSLARLFLLQDLRYVLILFLALSANSGNCLVHESMMAWIFSLGCLLIGTILSKFSSTNNLTNIWNRSVHSVLLSGFKIPKWCRDV